jgi:phage gp29-like protein
MGNTLSGNKDSTGSFALGVVHDDRRKDVLTYDCIMIERTLKKLIDRVVAMNYPGKAEYEVYYDTGDERDEARLADIYSKLTAAGYEIPVEHIEEMFNISGIRRKVTTPSNNYGFNSRRTERNSKQQIIDIEAQAEALPTKVIEDEIYTFIENAMKNATTYQEAIDALLEAYPNANFEKATDMMEKIATNAYVLGRTE